MSAKKCAVSIVIPTYNEIRNIRIVIPRIERMLGDEGIAGEILVVDDSSPDRTAAAAREMNRKYKNIRVLVKERKEGIGAALRAGYSSAYGNVIISSDADLSFDVKDMPRLLSEIRKGNDLVVGCRYLAAGGYEKKNITTWLKGIVSYAGNIAIRHISGIPLHDFSANFRAIRNDVWNSIKTQENTNTLLFEMILKTHCAGYRVAEIPVVFRERVYGESKLNLAVEAPKFFAKLVCYTLKAKHRTVTSTTQS